MDHMYVKYRRIGAKIGHGLIVVIGFVVELLALADTRPVFRWLKAQGFDPTSVQIGYNMVRDLQRFGFWMGWILMAFAVILLCLKSSIYADDASVTFRSPLTRTITIQYLDIQEINVYNRLHTTESSYKGRSGGRSDYYEEILEIVTAQKTYTFKTKMDAFPKPNGESFIRMDMVFQMGRFKAVQRFIEKKRSEKGMLTPIL